MKITILDRILLFLSCLLAAWQVAVGIDRTGTFPLVAYTIGFGVLLVAALLLIILGFEVLDSPIVVIASTIIPLSLSLGLVWEHLVLFRMPYLIFAILGFSTVMVTRLVPVKDGLPVLALAGVHGVAGLTICLLPVILVLSGLARLSFALVGLGGVLISAAGLLLSFLRMGRPVLPRNTLLKVLPGLLLFMTVCFVIGFRSA
jgi:hypothetical protein